MMLDFAWEQVALWILLYPVAALVLGARLWRLLPIWRRLHSRSLGA